MLLILQISVLIKEDSNTIDSKVSIMVTIKENII